MKTNYYFYTIHCDQETTLALLLLHYIATRKLLWSAIMLDLYYNQETALAFLHIYSIVHFKSSQVGFIICWIKVVLQMIFTVCHIIFPYKLGYAVLDTLRNLSVQPQFDLSIVAVAQLFMNNGVGVYGPQCLVVFGIRLQGSQ